MGFEDSGLHERERAVEWRLYLPAAILALLLVAALSYSLRTTARLEAVLAVRDSVARAHLQCEEFVCGKGQVGVSEVLSSIDEAVQRAETMLDGGPNQIQELVETIREFRNLTEARLTAEAETQADPDDLARRFHAKFRESLILTDRVGHGLRELARQDLGQLRLVHQTSIAACIGLALLVGTVFFRFRRLRRQDLSALRESEKAMEHEKMILENIISSNPYSIAIYDANGRFVRTNQAFKDLFLCDPPKDYVLFDDAVIKQASEEFARVLKGESVEMPEILFNAHDFVPSAPDKTLTLVGRAFPVFDSTDDLELIVLMHADITDRKIAEEERLRLERQVLQTQKLDSLGILAGGIAHDFNNLLMGILGYAELALKDLEPESRARNCVDQIDRAAQRAAELANQMLAYSGRGRFVVEPIDLNESVDEMVKLLEVSISKKVRLRFDFAELPAFEGDVTQVRQIIMNLITNASEAIGHESGEIIVRTGVKECGRDYLDTVSVASLAGLTGCSPEGNYVFLEVSDNGCGMDQETLERIFEPFFTTKFAGRGLGMAALMGIMRGHKGAIKVSSIPGEGTSIRALFPTSEELPSKVQSTGEELESWRGAGTILLVDDEETVRDVSKEMLEELGFDVLTAPDGRQGIDLFVEHSDVVTCVLLDMTMPHMAGDQVFREIRLLRPDAKVIMCSGYDEQEVTKCFVNDAPAGFIQKPYKLAEIESKLRELLY